MLQIKTITTGVLILIRLGIMFQHSVFAVRLTKSGLLEEWKSGVEVTNFGFFG